MHTCVYTQMEVRKGQMCRRIVWMQAIMHVADAPTPFTYVTRPQHVEDTWAHRETARSPVKPMMAVLVTVGGEEVG